MAILRHAEETEQLLSRLGLSLDILGALVLGRFPWPAYAWAKRLIDGVLDADRLAYVEQDSGLTLRLPVSSEVKRIVGGAEPDGSGEVTIVDGAISEDVVTFIKCRGSLYTDVYHHPVKTALDYIMRDVLRRLWDVGTAWLNPQFRKPNSVEEFLRWTDTTVAISLKETSSDSILTELRTLLREGRLIVAEITPLGGISISIAEIDKTLDSLGLRVFPDDFVWVIRSRDIGPVSIYEPGSVVVGDKSSFRPLESVHPTLIQLTAPLGRRPIIVADDRKVASVVKLLVESRLTLQQLQPIHKL